MSYCSLDNKSDICIDIESLKKIIELYNKYNNDHIIINDTHTANDLVSMLYEKFPHCKNEICLINQKFIDANFKKELYKYFLPIGPANTNEWLSNFDIENVMNQLEKNYDDYKFIGVFPINFDKYREYEFSKKSMDFLQIIKKTKWSFIINLDRVGGSGTHWVALYIDTVKHNIFYYDSVGKPPKKDTVELASKIENVLKTKYNTFYNSIQHQHGNSECGVFSLHFTQKILEDDDFNTFCLSKINDKTMTNYRKKYFIPKELFR